MITENLFKRLQLAGWRQFASVDIEFHPKLTVLTGANGAGKSTLLNILSRHVGVERPYLGVPHRDSTGSIRWLSGRLTSLTWWVPLFGSWKWAPNSDQIGEIEYTSGGKAQLTVPSNVGTSTYQIGITNQQAVPGVLLSSHRLLPSYQQVPNIPFSGKKPEEAYGSFINEAHQRHMGISSPASSLMFQIKQALAAWAAIGEGNSILQSDPIQKEAYDGFVNMLRNVLPDTLGFENLAIRPPDIVLVTRSGEFLIDAASGGITTLIETGALIYAASIRPDLKDQRFVVIYDEPENHLHPQLQRTLFQNLVRAFPQVQFVVATHSPFIVSSLKDSSVYVLRYKDTGDGARTEQTRVVSQKLDYANRAGNASEILREVLGLPNTLPQWVEDDLNRIVGQYQDRTLDKKMLAELQTELKAAGLEELYPEALSGLARQ